MKSQFIILFFWSLWIVNNSYSQNKNSTLGLSTAGNNSFNFQYKLSEYITYEGIVGWRDGGMHITVMAEKYSPLPIKNSLGLKLFHGPGIHTAYYHKKRDSDVYFNNVHLPLKGPALGFDYIFGIEYYFHKNLFSLAGSVKPYAELSAIRLFHINPWNFGLTLRYHF